jgi:hypothetical protein
MFVLLLNSIDLLVKICPFSSLLPGLPARHPGHSLEQGVPVRGGPGAAHLPVLVHDNAGERVGAGWAQEVLQGGGNPTADDAHGGLEEDGDRGINN